MREAYTQNIIPIESFLARTRGRIFARAHNHGSRCFAIHASQGASHGAVLVFAIVVVSLFYMVVWRYTSTQRGGGETSNPQPKSSDCRESTTPDNETERRKKENENSDLRCTSASTTHTTYIHRDHVPPSGVVSFGVSFAVESCL